MPLSTVKQGSTTKGTYAYDASGLRRRKVASGVTTIYHFDEAGHLLAETNTSGVMQRLYVWADGAPVAQKVSTTLTYLHTDHLDTPRWGTSTAGVLVWRWRSDGFGEAAPEQDPDGNGTQVSVNLRFPGQYYDAESGLHQNWMRDYTPGYGRYAQSDPIGLEGGMNTYGYASHHPTGEVDPTGEYGLPGFAGAATANFFGQWGVGIWVSNGDWRRAFRCIDFSKVLVSGAVGAIGPAFWANVVKGRPGPGDIVGRVRNGLLYAGVSLPTSIAVKQITPPIRIGDECECRDLKVHVDAAGIFIQ